MSVGWDLGGDCSWILQLSITFLWRHVVVIVIIHDKQVAGGTGITNLRVSE